MKISAPTRQAGEVIGDTSILNNNDAQQLGFSHAGSAPHTGAGR
ncbi:MAG: hypothetical protein QOC60_1357 [Frankiaceae bacterium]|nr:hypothetical protein [Frankiaceae bacterium]MDQ1715412.1 hypothetical protein [Frankiaceae bacterium]